MRFFLIFLVFSLSSYAGEFRAICVGIEPEWLAEGKFDLYSQDAVFMGNAFKRASLLKGSICVLNGANATRTNILKKVSEFGKVSKEKDTTVIFFSSHGDLDKMKKFYFSSAPEVKGEIWGKLSGREFNKALKALKGRIIVLLDTCCAAGLISERLDEEVSYIVASKASESSYGQFKDSSIPHGYFVIAACEALSGLADVNKELKVSLSEFSSYIKKRTSIL